MTLEQAKAILSEAVRERTAGDYVTWYNDEGFPIAVMGSQSVVIYPKDSHPHDFYGEEAKELGGLGRERERPA